MQPIALNVGFATVGREIFVAISIRGRAEARLHRRPVATRLVRQKRVVAASTVSAAIVQIGFATVCRVPVAVRETWAAGGDTLAVDTGGAAVCVFALDPAGAAVRQISSNIGFTAVRCCLVAILPAHIAAYDGASCALAHTLSVRRGARLATFAAVFSSAGEIGFAAVDGVGIAAVKSRRTNGCAGASHAGRASVIIQANAGDLTAVYNHSFSNFKVIAEKARARRYPGEK